MKLRRLRRGPGAGAPVVPGFFVRDEPATGFPCAIDGAGAVVTLALSHTLVVGKSGSGKGSTLWAITRACLPFVAGGYATLWGFDPKRAELEGTAVALFERVAFTPQDVVDQLGDLHQLMLSRQGTRSFEPSPERPLVVVHIDEFTSLFDALDRKQTDEAARLLRMVLLQGRSAGIVVIAYGQEATKEATALRDHFPQRICLRMQTPAEVELVLGAGSVAQGAASHVIAPASPSNGYATAGIAYLRGEGGEITRVRFPYTDDGQITALAKSYGAALRRDQPI